MGYMYVLIFDFKVFLSYRVLHYNSWTQSHIWDEDIWIHVLRSGSKILFFVFNVLFEKAITTKILGRRLTSIISRILDLLLGTRLLTEVIWENKRWVALSSVYTLLQHEQGENYDSPLSPNLTSRLFAFLTSFAYSSHSLLNELQWVLTEWHNYPIVSCGKTTFFLSTNFQVFW